MRFLIDTNVYGWAVAGDKESQWVLDYAKKHREQGFLSAINIIEASKFEMVWREIRPKLFECSNNLIEFTLPDFKKGLKLAWKYIQKLKLDKRNISDAELVAFVSLANLDIIITKDTRGVFEKENYERIRKINMKWKLKRPQMKQPKDLKQFLAY